LRNNLTANRKLAIIVEWDAIFQTNSSGFRFSQAVIMAGKINRCLAAERIDIGAKFEVMSVEICSILGIKPQMRV
jgi:hypothetical protein